MNIKHRIELMGVLSTHEIKSTNQILKELEVKTGKTINWHNLYRILMELRIQKKVERLQSKAGFFWRKK